jgi:hypothetical protein
MPPLLIAQLIVSIGFPAAQKLIAMIQSNTTVTPQMWEDLRKDIATPFAQLAGPK